MTIIAMILLLAFLVVLWRTQPAKADVTITAIQYTLDDITWIGLDGATLEPGYINVAVTWKNNSSEPVDTLLTLVVEDQGQEPDQERVTLAPNEEVTSALLMEFTEGERRVTAIIYEEETMKELGRMTASVSVKEEVKPAEFTVTNLRIVPTTLEVNHIVNLYVTVTNVGGSSGSRNVNITGDLSGYRSTGTLEPGQSKELNFSQLMTSPGTYYFDFGGLMGSFTVTEVAPPVEPAGHPIAIMANVEGKLKNLNGLEFKLNQTVPLFVSWKSDMSYGDPNIRGHVVLNVRKPDGKTVSLTATGGQDSVVAPDKEGWVSFSVNFSQKGAWNFEAILSGEIV